MPHDGAQGDTPIIDEKAIGFLEQHIPEQAVMALKQAYWQALASGSNVLICEDGHLVEIRPDGTRKILKKVPPPIQVKVGQKWHLH